MTQIPRLAGVSTAVPPSRPYPREAMARAARLFDGAFPDLDRLLGVFDNAAIETRHSCVPAEWYMRDHGFAERNRLYIENATALLETAARKALAAAGLAASDIEAIVTVSTTGIATPSLDALLMERLPFRRDAQRLPIFGLGCAGGVIGLGRAAAMARSLPAGRVLFLVVELCGLTFRPGDRSKSNLVAAALFGDGAAALVLAPDGAGPAITAWGEHCWPDSLDIMGWDVADDGFGVRFSRDIPRLVRRELRAAGEAFLARHGLTLDDIDGFVCHPGGAKVIEALEAAFGLPPGTMAEARAVLAAHGNMSAATLFFVLERALAGDAARDGARPHRRLLSALGPGFSAGFAVIEG